MTKAPGTIDRPTRIIGKADVFKKREVRVEQVPVPEWGGDGAVLLVRGMTGRERDLWEESMVAPEEAPTPFRKSDKPKTKKTVILENQRARIVSMCVVDEQGNRIFSDDDITALGEQDAAPLDRIYDVATALSGIGKEDIETVLGKYREAPSSASPSA
jgi:hypothetical protein